ncbi:MAG: leucine-rich repeat protein [Eubacterium sp.]|nr:leucine-rich repeat protein [Eubacterium sp.]
MKKTRKKGNLALRRRIRKTTASLFMILAIVVAMLPVENMKTTKAADIRPNVESNMDAYYAESIEHGNSKTRKTTDSTGGAIYEGKYSTSSVVTLQRITSSSSEKSFIEFFKANLNSSKDEAMITEYKSSIKDISIGEKEYYDYVKVDGIGGNYVRDIEAKFGTEKYTISFDIQVQTFSPVDSAAGLGEIKISTINTSSVDYDTDNVATGSLSGSYTNKFTEINTTDKKVYAKNIFEGSKAVEAEKLSSLKTEAGNYNTDANKAIAEVSALARITTLSESDKTKWNNYKASVESGNLKTSFDNCKSRTFTLADFTNDANSDGLRDIVNYTICNRMGTPEGKKLDQFTLECLYTEGGSAVYVPRLIGTKPNDTYFTDTNGYLAEGQVTVTGIAHDAFNRNNNVSSIESLSIPKTVQFVGKQAFANQDLETVTFDDTACKEIGDSAFEGCEKLTSFKFSSSSSVLEIIGNDAFKNTGAIEDITIPKNVTEVGRGCFANSKIKKVSFAGSNRELELYPFAFYSCANLTDVSFANDKTFIIGQCAFACGVGINDNLETFTFPAKMKKNAIIQSGTEEDYDYILAGRENLVNVVLPCGLGSTNITNGNKVPDNTLAGCTNLSTLTFPDDSHAGTYDEVELFRDIMNPQFYVIGPKTGTSSSMAANCREVTWKAAIDQDSDTSDKEYHVPYQYTEKGVKYLEIGVAPKTGSGLCIESIKVNSDNTTATLTGYDIQTTLSNNIEIEIPEKVGQYTITAIASGCVSDTLKPKVYKVSIADGTVKTIGSEAFDGCPALQWVKIGNSVTSIESKAFANCPKLENVEFSQNMITDWTTLKIATDAFSTQSDFLTFHGVIHPDYAPYVIASNKGATTQSLTATGNEICYMTDAPLNLTVIKDNGTSDNNGKMTLIDYPHYEDIDADNSIYIAKMKADVNASAYSIINRFEYFNGIVSTASGSYTDDGDLKTKEKNIVDQTLNMDLPEGIESIDSKAFFTATKENAGSIKYFNRTYNDTGTEIKTLSRKYSNGGNAYERLLNHTIASKYHAIENVYSTITEGTGSTPEEVIPGLFSGYFYGNQTPSLVSVVDPATGTHKVYNGHTYVEEVSRGNDHLTSINLESVTTLPDYAFDSNENLLSVSFSDKMTQIGALPFRGCKALTTVNTNGNTKYIFDNGILYEVLDNGSYKIIECLESRANGINKTNDPNLTKVSELADGCFSNCEELTDVDLTAAKFTTLPADAFNGCDKLTTVSLPNTVQTIKDTAFSNIEGTGSVTVSIPNLNCTLNKGMCDGSTKKFNIKGVKYRDEINGVYSSCYDSFEDLQKAYGKDSTGNYKAEWYDYDQTFTVTFKLLDNTVIGESQEVSKGKDATPPTAPDINGKKFVNWYCEINGVLYNDSSAYTNITEDRTIFAVYNDDKTVVVSDGNKYTLTMSTGQASLASDLTTYSSSLQAAGGTSIAIIYNSTTVDFTTWSAKGTSSGTDYSSLINPITATTALFTMPNDNVTIGINTVTSSGSGSGSSGSGSSGSGSNSGSGNSDNTTKYKLTVNYGSGSGEYAAGEIVSISANAPDSSTRVFSKWTSSTSGVGFADATKVSTTITMPASAVVVTANYKTRTSDDEDDDSSSSSSNRRPQSNTTSTTVTTGTGTTTSTNTNTGATNNATNNTQTTGNGDELYITKNGVSNKDVGNANVEGSTDNFVVKISDSEDAAELAKQALLNKYGSLDGIAYFPMDISLFDASGNNQITDTYGLNVTVTMPIPDTLIQYGGNAHVAAVEGGYLQDLTPKFTTIDGIGCISFIPPHFSPYVIYVDTNNLVAGQTLDSTPQTGDPIHPKWFLATGMACLSVFLFVSGDRKKKIKLA